MSPTYQNSRESGIDVYSGGAKYNNTSIVGAGLATLADSLIAVKKVVFEENFKTLDELKFILLSNWQQDEKLRLRVKKKYSKFGNNEDEADKLATEIYHRFSALINGRKNGRGGVFRCGMFSVDWRFWMGEKSGATPDGRYANTPIADGVGPRGGYDVLGPTAAANSVAKLDHAIASNGTLYNQKFHPSALSGVSGLMNFASYIRAFFDQKGMHMQFNVVSKETLLDAQKNPENYKNLVVRVAGYSALFTTLSKALQDDIINRTEQAFNV